jgi:UDP-glucose 4-epimerase
MSPFPKKVLITGGAGFIGTHLAERLRQRAQVVLFDNIRRDSLSLVPELLSDPNVTLIRGNVLDPASLEPAFDGVEAVLHLAAIAGVGSYHREPLNTLRVNLLGTVNVLDQVVKHGVKTMVDFSTSEVFGPNAFDVKETDPCGIGPSSDLRWVYATSKIASEHFCLRTAAQHGFACTIVRPFNIYGPRQTGEGAIGNFCRAAIDRRPLTVYGSGGAIRAWCFVSDMVHAVERILETPAAAGEVFNIGNAREVETTLGLARRIVQIEPGARINFQPMEGSEVRVRVPSIDKARAILGYEPQVDLDRGLRATLASMKAVSCPAA